MRSSSDWLDDDGRDPASEWQIAQRAFVTLGFRDGLDTGAEHLKCVCCEPQCTGCGPNCARFFKCSCQCCCCVQLGALPCTAEMPCTCALLGYMCYPSRQRGCCHKLLPPLNDEGVTLQEMNRDGTVRKA